MQVSLALRKTDSKGVWKIVSVYTRWRIQTSYPHAGIILGDTMYDISSNGLSAVPYDASEWDIFPTESALDPREEHACLKRVMCYDFLSLLVFLLPIKYRNTHKMYCYEWAWYILTGSSAEEKVTPENLLALVLKNELLGGNK